MDALLDGVMKSVNPTLQLRYDHSDQTRMMKDVRKRRSPELGWDQIYFVGLRIETGRDVRYHHALILADDHDSFLDGIAGEFNTILNQPRVTSAKEITLVFVRSLMILDSDLQAAAASQNITRDIQEELTKRNDNQYLVYGMVGKSTVCLVKLQADNALLAIDQARKAVMAKYQQELLLLEVCQLHPVTAECYALFNAAADRIKPLLSNDSSESVYVL